MKIKTITCHHVYNYGASLQAYALQHFLENKGNEVEIINYLPTYKRNRYDFWELAPNGPAYRLGKKCPLLKPFIAIYKNSSELFWFGRKSMFNEFDRRFLHITSKLYRNIEDLKEFIPQADCYIAGSDQIWNPRMGNGKDPAYYCCFSKNSKINIAYAASFGVSDLGDSAIFIKDKLKNFRCISVREKTGVFIVEKLGYKALQVVDPVFLLPLEEWEAMCKRKFNQPYLLVYDFDHDNAVVEQTVKKIANEKGLRIISINDYQKLPYADININNAGPIEFLELIKNATFVISTSFHATAFSVIFQRQFLTFPMQTQGNSSRMTDFLDTIGIIERFIRGENQPLPTSQIHYEKVIAKLETLQNKSRKWLLDNISSIENDIKSR